MLPSNELHQVSKMVDMNMLGEHTVIYLDDIFAPDVFYDKWKKSNAKSKPESLTRHM